MVCGWVFEVECNWGGIWLEMDGLLVLWIELKVFKVFDVKWVM